MNHLIYSQTLRNQKSSLCYVWVIFLQEGNWKELLKAASILDQEDADYMLFSNIIKTKAVKSLDTTRKEN